MPCKNTFFLKKKYLIVIFEENYIQLLYALKDEQEEALEVAIATFRRYIQNNQNIAKDRQLAYINFVNVVKRLCTKYWAEIENCISKKQRRVVSNAILLADIQKMGALAEKQWLEEKIKEFNK